MMKYDKTLKVGDIVTCYYKGYWRITDIDFNKNLSSNGLVTCVKILDSNMKPARNITEQCDISYCKRVKQSDIDDVSLAFAEGIKRLNALIEGEE